MPREYQPPFEIRHLIYFREVARQLHFRRAAETLAVAQPALSRAIAQLETALAAKFNETILDALGVDAERPAGFEDIESLPQKFIVMPVDLAQMKTYIAANTGL